MLRLVRKEEPIRLDTLTLLHIIIALGTNHSQIRLPLALTVHHYVLQVNIDEQLHSSSTVQHNASGL
jgi:hypothetical protein